MNIVRIPGTEVALVNPGELFRSQWTLVGREVFDQAGKLVNSVATAEVLEALDNLPDPVKAATTLWRFLAAAGQDIDVHDGHSDKDSFRATIDGVEYVVTVTPAEVSA